MPGALLDTNAISDLMKDHAKLKARVLRLTAGSLRTSVIVLGEFRYGIERLPVGKKRSELEAKAKSMLPSFLKVETVTLPILPKNTLELARISRPADSIWTTTICGSHVPPSTAASSLSPGIRCFSGLPGLVVEDWTV